MTQTSAEDMTWPTLRHKLWPIRIVRWKASNGFNYHYRVWYFGPWLCINLGRVGILIGSGIYV